MQKPITCSVNLPYTTKSILNNCAKLCEIHEVMPMTRNDVIDIGQGILNDEQVRDCLFVPMFSTHKYNGKMQNIDISQYSLAYIEDTIQACRDLDHNNLVDFIENNNEKKLASTMLMGRALLPVTLGHDIRIKCKFKKNERFKVIGVQYQVFEVGDRFKIVRIPVEINSNINVLFGEYRVEYFHGNDYFSFINDDVADTLIRLINHPLSKGYNVIGQQYMLEDQIQLPVPGELVHEEIDDFEDR